MGCRVLGPPLEGDVDIQDIFHPSSRLSRTEFDGDVRQALRPLHLTPQGIGSLPDAAQQLRIGHLLSLGDEAGNRSDIRLSLRIARIGSWGCLQGDSIGDQDPDSIGFNYRVP